MLTTLLELTGRVSILSAPRQAMKMLWSRDLVLNVEGGSQPGEGLVKIQFSGERLLLLDEVQVGDTVTVAFLIRGVEYEREGVVKQLVVLVGKHVWLHQTAPRKLVLPASVLAEAEQYDAADLDEVTDEVGFQVKPMRLGSRQHEPQSASDVKQKTLPAPESPRQRKNVVAKAKDSSSLTFPKSRSFEEPPF